MNILALDVGTSAVKAAILDVESAQPIAPVAKVPYELDSPIPDAFEIPPQRLHEATWSAAREAAAGLPKGASLDGIGLSCLTPALVLLDSAEQPLSPIWIHLDRRSRPLARKVWEEVGPDFLETCGNRPLPGGMSALCFGQQIAEDTSLRQKVRHYLHANGWLGLLMTGERYFDRANASFTGLFNTVTDQEWSPRWCDYFQVDMGWLPPVVCGSTTIGTLRDEVAREWGLKQTGLPVKLGTADTSSAMLAAEMKPGDLLHSVGTTQVLGTLITNPKPDIRRLTRLFGVGDSYVYVAHNPVGGSALDWLHELCFRDQSKDHFYSQTVRECAHRETPVRLDPPFLGGDRLEIEARRAAFRELTLATQREDILTALLHAMRDGHRAAFASLDWGDHPINRIILTGGGSDTVRELLPEYQSASIETIEEGAMRGVAKLFDSEENRI
jgi:xylulokinase